jgi:hypothetical protein
MDFYLAIVARYGLMREFWADPKAFIEMMMEGVNKAPSINHGC